MKSIVILVLSVLSLSGCKTQNILSKKYSELDQDLEILDSAFAYSDSFQYHIKTDDKITISVWGQDELSVGSSYGIYNSNEVYGKWLMVDAKGQIEIPKIGTTLVSGLTTLQLKDSLKYFFGEYINNPIVDIKILNKEITVLGEVRNPGVFNVDKDHNTLLNIIARSGGFEFYANLKYIKVFRQKGPNVHVATLNLKDYGDYFNQNIQLHPDDIVVVPSKKYKEFDKRISTIIPLTSTVTAAAIFMKAI